MFDLDRWQEIYSALRKNKMRTFLTAFGVFWGIFMLVIMLGSGNGLQNGAMSGFQDFATNSAFIWTQNTTIAYKGFVRGRHFMLNNEDMKVLLQRIPEIGLLAPRLEGGNQLVTNGLKNGSFTIQGDYPTFNQIDPNTLILGRFMNDNDIADSRKVVMIGRRVREVLFDTKVDPIGKYIAIKGGYYQVVGIFKPKNPNINFGGDKDQTIFMPFTTMQKAYNFGDQVHYFAVTAKIGEPASVVEEKCLSILAERHSVSPEDKQAFGHFNLEQEYKKMTGLFMGISGLIWIVGVGTLLAGVIGVSNIMLIIVKERTKEIGIQRALGAVPSTIIGQIISESVFLTTFAGYFGLVVGVGLLELIGKLMQGGENRDSMFKNPEINFHIAMIALTILILSGALAGFIPAKRAVSIKPIDALRYE